MSWMSSAVAAQQQSANQQTPYGSSSNQYILNNSQDNYLQSLANFHQSPATHPSYQPQYWSAVPTALMYPGPQPMLAQQQTLSNEQQSPQSKTNNNNNRPLTPSNSTDLLSSSQPNQQQQYINMSRAAQTPGTKIRSND